GVGSPIPEDLLLLTAGYLVFSGVFVWPAALAIGLAGVVISDVMLFSAGRRWLLIAVVRAVPGGVRSRSCRTRWP
ncbi:MAG: hypothetical protein Q8L75_19330, partial [Acidobacteriota bacterium]|nr:hypothetical protein [Acidobacteriota bacterium]